MIKAVIALKKAIANVVFRKLIAEIKLGDFLIFRAFADAFGITDVQSSGVNKSVSDSSTTSDEATLSAGKSLLDNTAEIADEIDAVAIGKTVQDVQGITEDINFGMTTVRLDAFIATESVNFDPNKALTDSSVAAENLTIQFLKGLFDVSAFSDVTLLAPTKAISDISTTSEDQNIDFHKFIAEDTGVTDDLDGEATADDDQKMTYVKVRTDVAAFSDLFAHSIGRGLSDTIGSSDSGNLRGQGYCAFDYFEADYVGYSQTF